MVVRWNGGVVVQIKIDDQKIEQVSSFRNSGSVISIREDLLIR